MSRVDRERLLRLRKFEQYRNMGLKVAELCALLGYEVRDDLEWLDHSWTLDGMLASEWIEAMEMD